MLNRLTPAMLAVVSGGFSLIPASETRSADPAIPEPVSEQHFELLLEHSPFTRSLNLADSLVLTGFAELNGEPYVTVIDTTDGRTMAISENPNLLGWKLVEFERPEDLEVAKASVAFQGGETILVYYDKERAQKASQVAARGMRERSLQFAAKIIANNILPDSINEIQDPVEKGRAIAKFIEGGGFDRAPDDAIKMALSQSNPQARGTVMSAAFGRLGGGVGGIQINDAVKRLNSLEDGRDRDFAINGLAHGLAGRDPKGALRWANSISNEGFRKVVVENVTRRIERR